MNDPSSCTLTNSRIFAASPEELFAAFREPQHLAQWWGPAGFRNTIHAFDFQPGGLWIYDMHGPDGTDYPNRSRFEEIGPQRIVLRHLEPEHTFTMAMSFVPEGDGTRLTWQMRFDNPEECDRVRAFVPRCNEENFDRLDEFLQSRQP